MLKTDRPFDPVMRSWDQRFAQRIGAAPPDCCDCTYLCNCRDMHGQFNPKRHMSWINYAAH